MQPAGGTAFVLGGGGVLGAAEVGMLHALIEAGIHPDLVVGTSVGALNGAVVAADPSAHAVERLTGLWQSVSGTDLFGGSPLSRVARMARERTALHSLDPLRAQLREHLGDIRFEDLAVPFECCAASIERAAEHWFTSGPLIEAVMASCAVPGLFPAVRMDGEHFVDGGMVNSIPVSRAVELGATRVYVLQVGRIERPLSAPTRPWQVAVVAFEIARRHRFARDLAAVPAGVTVHVLPTGGEGDVPLANLRLRHPVKVEQRIEVAHAATAAYLASLT